MDKMGLPYSEQEAAKVLEGILSAMRCLHSMHITHRDLKPENLMYASDVEVLSQFVISSSLLPSPSSLLLPLSSSFLPLLV